MEKNTVQAEVTKFNSMKITLNQSGAEFVDNVEAQEVTVDDELTRLKEGLTDRRYSQLAHSLYVANDMTYTRASSLMMGNKNTSFGKHEMQKSGKDDVNTAVDVPSEDRKGEDRKAWPRSQEGCEEVNMAQSMSNGRCHKMIVSSRKHMKNLKTADRQITTAHKGNLK